MEFVVKAVVRYPWRVLRKPYVELRDYFRDTDSHSEQNAGLARFLSSMLSLAYAYYECGNEMKKVDECIEKWGKCGYEKISPKEFRSQKVRNLLENDRHAVIVLRRKRNQSRFGADVPRGLDQNSVLVLFRGTVFGDPGDVMEDSAILIEHLHTSERVTASKALVDELVSEYGHERVCLVGHSLGAAIAFLIARDFYLDRKQSLEGHYFNLPFMCLETLCREILDVFEWEYSFFIFSVTALGLKSLLNRVLGQIKYLLSHLQRRTSQEAAEKFDQLKGWKPNIYVNIYDRISRSYITYFQDACSEVHGPNAVGKSGVSLFTAILRTLGMDSKAHHLIPSCNLFISERGFSTFNSHPLKNWETVKPRHLRLVSYNSFIPETIR